jgi:hypothetical protein
LDYALEFKPDTPALIFFALLTALVLSDLKLPRRLVYLTLCAAGAALFKQQILVAMAALCAARVLWGHPLRDRLTDVISISLGACIGLAISLSIENAFFFTIISHMGRPTVKLLDMAHAELLVRVALLAAAALALHGLRGALKQTARVGRILPYSVPAAAWLLICLAGARNLGGNSGNTAVGLALLLPFAALLLDRMDVRLRSMMFIAVTLFSATYLVVSDWRERYRGRVTTEIQVAQELRRIGADHVLASGDSYIATRRADVAKISEIDVWAHIHNGRSGGVVPPDGPALIAEVRPDAIVCLQGCNVFARYDFDPVAAGYSEISVPASALKGVLYVRDQSLPNAGNAVAP